MKKSRYYVHEVVPRLRCCRLEAAAKVEKGTYCYYSCWIRPRLTETRQDGLRTINQQRLLCLLRLQQRQATLYWDLNSYVSFRAFQLLPLVHLTIFFQLKYCGRKSNGPRVIRFSTPPSFDEFLKPKLKKLGKEGNLWNVGGSSYFPIWHWNFLLKT